MRKKGFTLIELLAVIVILAVIAVIATPAVLNIIEDSKKSAAEASARSIVGAAKTHYMQNIMDNKPNSNVDLSTNTLKYDGEQAKKGLLSYDTNGNVSGKMYISGYCIEVAADGTITSTKTNESECSIDIPQVTTYTNGTVVYYNPETNTKCTSAEAVSTTGTKTGCMRWYAFNDEGTDTINLLLDHNTTATVAWISKEDYIAAGGTEAEWGLSGNNNKGPITALKQLESDTSTWNKSINARLIEASEIATITGNNGWTVGDDSYYFHTNSNTEYKGAAGTNKYAWLFDNTRECTTYGCNVEDSINVGYYSSNTGYWTNTAYSGNSNLALIVSNRGTLSYNSVGVADYLGVRPVITVQKSVIS